MTLEVGAAHLQAGRHEAVEDAEAEADLRVVEHDHVPGFGVRHGNELRVGEREHRSCGDAGSVAIFMEYWVITPLRPLLAVAGHATERGVRFKNVPQLFLSVDGAVVASVATIGAREAPAPKNDAIVARVGLLVVAELVVAELSQSATHQLSTKRAREFLDSLPPAVVPNALNNSCLGVRVVRAKPAGLVNCG